jgi:hypothetical protein
LQDGFAGSALRALVCTFKLQSRTTHPQKFFASEAEAAEFVSGHMARTGASSVAASTIAGWYETLTKDVWRIAS